MRLKEYNIILENAKFTWTDEEIEHARLLFSQGVKPSVVAEIMDQKIIDVSLLLIHLINEKMI
ncbi:hypothetical protein EMQU_0774 [Enterococcus mundtii QU 25]|uniref:hypothetical protein n=1 Tax=Enterococcus mundtii TaxID=53346 RepID=UPI0003C56AFB|nr:hypothetical protein [Enterococcus mundtii]BAO06331.1 hypothetical protein EMQU_0774 [Enterococcus mundtii QU 25]